MCPTALETCLFPDWVGDAVNQEERHQQLVADGRIRETGGLEQIIRTE